MDIFGQWINGSADWHFLHQRRKDNRVRFNHWTDDDWDLRSEITKHKSVKFKLTLLY